MNDKKELELEDLEKVNGGTETSDSNSSIIDDDGRTKNYDASILLTTLQSGCKK